MPLSDADADLVGRDLAKRLFVDLNATATLDRDDLRIMVQSLYAFLEANAAAVNSAIPLAQRTKATTQQKSFALAVAAMKYGGLI